MDAQIVDSLEFSYCCSHRLAGEALAHSAGFVTAFLIVDSSSGVVAALPADGD
jgi:hypothetical protein